MPERAPGPSHGPYVQDGHYMYGNMLNQPYPAYYNSSWYHREPPRRSLSSLIEFFDDGSVYVGDAKPNGTKPGPIVRGTSTNIINVETIAFKSLRVKLYALKEEDDVDVLLELGKRYSVTYITEGGMMLATGILKYIDSSIPDTCTRYVGEFNETVATAWIGLDCSTEGRSDKRKIYVASIRGLEDATDPDYVPPEIDPEIMSDSEMLIALMKAMPGFNNKLDQILLKVADNDEIMDKLNDMDVTEKVNYIINKLDTETEEVKTLINDKSDEVKTLIRDKHAEAVVYFKEIIRKLGRMPYDDKIDYIVNKINETLDDGGNVQIGNADTNAKVNWIIDQIEGGITLAFLDDDGTVIPNSEVLGLNSMDGPTFATIIDD